MILDVCFRRVMGSAKSDRLKRGMAVDALRRALAIRNPHPGLVHHSDRGSQYLYVDDQAELRKRGIVISISGKGDCHNNAIARYIDGFYDPFRRHSSLGFQGPVAFERKAREVS